MFICSFLWIGFTLEKVKNRAWETKYNCYYIYSPKIGYKMLYIQGFKRKNLFKHLDLDLTDPSLTMSLD